ncbi:MAG TPA: NAD-dependent epimerase/dehydratase family protein, partial [Puia sp.]|nr:NAD-dependent epimerase/dehydratase family protein [Puia sp.]
MINKKIIIAGGTGFIGQALAARWGKDNRIVILSRGRSGSPNNSFGGKPPKAEDGYHITYSHWDGRTVGKHWADELEGCDMVVNLAGRSVNCRYNARNKRDIFDSRTDATHALGQAISAAVMPPKLWVNATSATIYRNATDRPQDEYTGELGEGFSVEVCKKWERVFFGERTPFTRKIAIRTAITLGHGGVIVPYLRMVRFGLGGRQGNGRQMYSWVHIDDVARAIEWFFDQPEMEGVYNVAAPGPATNDCFMATLRRLKGVRIALPA